MDKKVDTVESKGNVDKFGDFINKVYQYGLLIFIMSILTLITYYNAHMTSYFVKWEVTYYVKDNFLVNFSSVFILIIFLFLISKTKLFSGFVKYIEVETNFNKIKIIMLLIIFVLSAIWALSTQYIPGVDEGDIQHYAYYYAQKNYYMFTPGEYMNKFPIQWGLFLFVYYISKIFGNDNYIIFQLINAFAIAILYKQLADIGKIWRLKKISQLMILFFGVIFIPVLCYSEMVYGNLIGMAFAFTAIKYEFIFFNDYKKKDALLSALCISFAILFKSTMSIYLVAIVIWALVKMIRERRVWILLFFAFIAIGYEAQSNIPGKIIEYQTGYQMENPCSMWSFIAMGLQESELAPGWWNQYIETSYTESGNDTEIQTQMAKESIKQSISNFYDKPVYSFEFFTKKLTSTWTNPTFQCFETVKEGTNIKVPNWVYYLLSREGQYIAVKFLNILEFIVLAGTLIGIILNFKSREFSDTLVLLLIFVGGFIFHIFWEAKSRYALLYFLTLIPYAVMGYEKVINGLSTLITCKRDGKNYKVILKTSFISRLYPIILFAGTLVICMYAYSGNRESYLTQDTDKYYNYLKDNSVKLVLKDGTYNIHIGDYALSLLESQNDYGHDIGLISLSDLSDEINQEITIASYQGTSIIYFENTQNSLTSFNEKLGNDKAVASVISDSENNKRWTIKKTDDNLYTIIDNEGYSLTWDTNSESVYLSLYTESVNQKWEVTK